LKFSRLVKGFFLIALVGIVLYGSLLVPRFVEYSEMTSSRGRTLIRAVQAEDAPVVRLLLMSGADTAARDPYGAMTPLDYAAMAGDVKIAHLLLRTGAVPNKTKEWEWTQPPLLYAAAAQDREMVDLLLEYGADYTLESALLLGDTKFVEKALLENPEALSGIGFFGGSLLSFAVNFDRLDVARYLLDLGLDPALDTVRYQGQTLLDRASALNRQEFMKLFEPYYSTNEPVSERIDTVN
jgi:ankyrin repeat protein